MKILIGVFHPKQVYLFKNTIDNLVEKGHEIKIIAVDKEITGYLLRQLNIPFTIIGKNQPKFYKKLFELPRLEYLTYKVSKEFKPDIFVGRASPYLAQVSALLNKPFILVEDTEMARALHRITVPLAQSVVTPECYKDDFGEKHIRFNGYFELCYLHPNQFKPDASILDEIGLSKEDRFIILRFIAWGANHDMGLYGIKPEKRKKYILQLEQYGRVFISSESELSPEFKKYELKISGNKFHSLLNYAQLYLGEGGTTAAEAAILGTPSIHIEANSKGRATGESSGNFLELRDKYGLLYFYPDEEQALEKAREILENKNSKAEWGYRREKLLRDKIDVTAWMTDFIERYPESFYEYRRGNNV